MTFINFLEINKSNALCPTNYINISTGRGFLPPIEPLLNFENDEFKKLVNLSLELHTLLKNKDLVRKIEEEFELDHEALIDCANLPVLQRAYAMITSITHAYIIEKGGDRELNKNPVTICKELSIYLNALSNAVGRLPTQTYETYVLQNYKLIDETKEISLENITPLITYTGSAGEGWFIKVHVVAEYLGGKILRHFDEVRQNIAKENIDEIALINILDNADKAMHELNQHIKSMNYGLDSKDFFFNIRAYLKAWEPGVIYEDGSYGGATIVWRGSSGAQSSIIPALDRLMGLNISQLETMKDMINYMPPEHVSYLHSIDSFQVSLRELVKNSSNANLVEAYNNFVLANVEFRKIHYEEIIEKYIVANLVEIFYTKVFKQLSAHEVCDVQDESKWSDDHLIKKLLYSLFKITKAFIVENAEKEFDAKEIISILKSVHENTIKYLPVSCVLDNLEVSSFEYNLVQLQCNAIQKIVTPLETEVDICIINIIGQTNIDLTSKTLGSGGTDFTYFLQHNIIQASESVIELGGCRGEKCEEVV